MTRKLEVLNVDLRQYACSAQIQTRNVQRGTSRRDPYTGYANAHAKTLW